MTDFVLLFCGWCLGWCSCYLAGMYVVRWHRRAMDRVLADARAELDATYKDEALPVVHGLPRGVVRANGAWSCTMTNCGGRCGICRPS
jgi:hypothetical protein